MGETSLVQIPNFVSAVTPMGLRRAMLMNNAKYRLVFNYYSVSYANGRWFAWFYQELGNDDPLLGGGVK